MAVCDKNAMSKTFPGRKTKTTGNNRYFRSHSVHMKGTDLGSKSTPTSNQFKKPSARKPMRTGDHNVSGGELESESGESTDSDDDDYIPCFGDIPSALIMAGVYTQKQLDRAVRKELRRSSNKKMSKAKPETGSMNLNRSGKVLQAELNMAKTNKNVAFRLKNDVTDKKIDTFTSSIEMDPIDHTNNISTNTVELNTKTVAVTRKHKNVRTDVISKPVTDVLCHTIQTETGTTEIQSGTSASHTMNILTSEPETITKHTTEQLETITENPTGQVKMATTGAALSPRQTVKEPTESSESSNNIPKVTHDSCPSDTSQKKHTSAIINDKVYLDVCSDKHTKEDANKHKPVSPLPAESESVKLHADSSIPFKTASDNPVEVELDVLKVNQNMSHIGHFNVSEESHKVLLSEKSPVTTDKLLSDTQRITDSTGHIRNASSDTHFVAEMKSPIVYVTTKSNGISPLSYRQASYQLSDHSTAGTYMFGEYVNETDDVDDEDDEDIDEADLPIAVIYGHSMESMFYQRMKRFSFVKPGCLDKGQTGRKARDNSDVFPRILESFSANVAEKRHRAFVESKAVVESTQVLCSSCRRPECKGEQMVQRLSLRRVARQEGFDVVDVNPDGNCMFSAVVDQLQQYGDYRFEMETLREEAVDWLVDNPYNVDGTPFAQFTEEDWETYLLKMRQTGQWGDHVMLRALSEILSRTIRVLNTGHDQLWTVITPQNSVKPEVGERPLHLGQLGESHYTSLRYADRQDEVASPQHTTPLPRDTRGLQRLFKVSDDDHTRLAQMFQSTYVDDVSKVPALHFSFLLKILCQATSVDYSIVYTLKTLCMMLPDGVSLRFQLDLHDHLLTTSSLLSPFIVKEDLQAVSCNNNDVHRGDLVIQHDGVHPGFTKLLINLSDPDHHNKKYVDHSVCKTHTSRDKPCKEGFLSTQEVIHCPSWPDIADEWRSRLRLEGWPGETVVQAIVRDGCHLLAESHRKSMSPEIEWKFSFALAELSLFREAVSQSQKECFRFFVALCLHALISVKCVLIEQMRSVFLISCERLPTDVWRPYRGSCVMFMVRELFQYVKDRFLPNYFIPSNNMLDSLDEFLLPRIEHCLDSLCKEPLKIVAKITMESMAYEGDYVIRRVSEDFPQFEADRDIKRSTCGVFVSLINEVAKDKISNGYYQKGYQLLTDAFEERLSVSTCDDSIPFQFFLSDVVSDLDTHAATWFWAYIRQQLGSQFSATFLTDARGSSPKKPLNSVLPEGLACGFGDTRVPAKWCDNEIALSLMFARFLARIDSASASLKVYQHCHHLYLQRFGDNIETKHGGQKTDLGSVADFMVEVYVGIYHLYLKQNKLNKFLNYLPYLQQICESLNCYGSRRLLFVIISVLGTYTASDTIADCTNITKAPETFKCDIIYQMFIKWPYYLSIPSDIFC